MQIRLSSHLLCAGFGSGHGGVDLGLGQEGWPWLGGLGMEWDGRVACFGQATKNQKGQKKGSDIQRKQQPMRAGWTVKRRARNPAETTGHHRRQRKGLEEQKAIKDMSKF